jgi:hypothetical protein
MLRLPNRFLNGHPLMRWYDAYCKYQQATIKTPGEVCTAVVTGIVACYLRLAYSLYLLDHNVEIQERLLGPLRAVFAQRMHSSANSRYSFDDTTRLPFADREKRIFLQMAETWLKAAVLADRRKQREATTSKQQSSGNSAQA